MERPQGLFLVFLFFVGIVTGSAPAHGRIQECPGVWWTLCSQQVRAHSCRHNTKALAEDILAKALCVDDLLKEVMKEE